MNRNFLIILLGIFFLQGCDDTKSKDWYKEHVDQMKERYEQCKESGSDSQDCRNVKEAHFEWVQLHAKPLDFSKAFKSE